MAKYRMVLFLAVFVGLDIGVARIKDHFWTHPEEAWYLVLVLLSCVLAGIVFGLDLASLKSKKEEEDVNG